MSMQQSYLGSMQDTTRGSPGRQPNTPSKNQSLNSSMKRTTSSTNAEKSKSEFPWDSPKRLADYLQEIVRNNLDQFAADLPKIISAIFGIPMTPEDVYAALNEEKKMKPLLFRVSEDSSGMGGNKLVQLVRARSPRTDSGQASQQSSEREEHGLLAAVRKVRRYHHNAKDFTFPCCYIPSSRFPRAMMGSDQIVTDRATGQSMMRCNAYELLIYAVAAFPIVCRERDIYVPQHNSDEEFRMNFGQGYNGPSDAYLIILESYLEDVLNSQARKQASDDAVLLLEVFSAYWFMPNLFDLSRSRSEPFGPGIPCLEHTLVGLPTRRHLKAAVALMRIITKDDAVQTYVGPNSPTVAQQRSYGRAPPRSSQTLSWAIQAIQPSLYLFLRRAVVHAQTQWSASKNLEAGIEPGGDLERYIELWKVVTTPRLRNDAWGTYVQGSFLFFTVVLIDILRLLKVIFRDLHKSVSLPTRHRSQYRFLTRLLDDFFDVPQVTSTIFNGASSYVLSKPVERRGPKERWQQACRARNQVLHHMRTYASRHAQQPHPPGDDYGLDLAMKHWVACLGGGSEQMQEVFGRYMEQDALQEFPIEDGDRKVRVVAEVPGQSLLEPKMLDDFVLAETTGHQWRMVWRSQYEADREGRSSPGKGERRRGVVWQQLYREVDGLQQLFMRAAQSVMAVKQARGFWQYCWEEVRDRLSVQYENGSWYRQDPSTQLLHVIRKMDLFWDDYPSSGERACQLWDEYPESYGSVRRRGDCAGLGWDKRESMRADLLKPQRHHLAHSDVESLCKRVWQSLDRHTFSELFGDGKGGPGPSMDKAAFVSLFNGSDILGAGRLRVLNEAGTVRPEDIEELWSAMDVTQSGSVTYADLAALLSPDEGERSLFWRDKLLRGERRCCLGGRGEAHVPALAGQGSPLPLVSPHHRKAAKAERSSGAGRQATKEGYLRAKGLPRSGVKRGLLVLQLWVSDLVNHRLQLPWTVELAGGLWGGGINIKKTLDADAGPELDEGRGALHVLALLLWISLPLALFLVPLCALLGLVGLAAEVCAVPLTLKWLVTCISLLIPMALLLRPPPSVLGLGLHVGSHVISHVFYGGRRRFNIRRFDLTRFSPWWLVIWPTLTLYLLLFT